MERDEPVPTPDNPHPQDTKDPRVLFVPFGGRVTATFRPDGVRLMPIHMECRRGGTAPPPKRRD